MQDIATSDDPLGFSSLELAKLLGDVKGQHLLGYQPPESFKVLMKGEKGVLTISLEMFEKFFGLTYRPFITFSSYKTFAETVKACPYILRPKWLATENHENGRKFFQAIWSGKTADVSVRWIDEVLGYGLFAEEAILKGSFIGTYAGVIRVFSPRHLFSLLSLRTHVKDEELTNDYCLHYPTRFWSSTYRAIDSLREGNLLRFMNHSDSPNVTPLCAVDRNLLHMVFIAARDIEKGEPLTFNYGPAYWQHRTKKG